MTGFNSVWVQPEPEILFSCVEPGPSFNPVQPTRVALLMTTSGDMARAGIDFKGADGSWIVEQGEASMLISRLNKCLRWFAVWGVGLSGGAKP